MCEPITLSTGTVLALTAASAAVAAGGAVIQGQAAAQQGKYQAAVARNNQIIAERQAQDAEKRGEIAETQQRQRVAAMLGTQRARLAGQGSDLSSGSAADIQADTAGLGEIDALTIRDNAAREAYGYRVQGMNFSSEAQLAQMRGQHGRLAGFVGAGSSLLGGASSVGAQWVDYTRRGIAPFGRG